MEEALTLRVLDVSDIDDFMVWVSDRRVTRFCTFDTYKSKEDGIKYINNTVASHPWFRAICINGRPVGAISVTPNSGKDRERTAELGYVKMVVSTIFGEWSHLERLVDLQNVGVLEKAGFQREGVLRRFLFLKGESRDMVMFSFLSTDDQIMS